jgi:hypothetical protein
MCRATTSISCLHCLARNLTSVSLTLAETFPAIKRSVMWKHFSATKIAAILKITVLWVMTPCRRRFGGTYCLQFLGSMETANKKEERSRIGGGGVNWIHVTQNCDQWREYLGCIEF